MLNGRSSQGHLPSWPAVVEGALGAPIAPALVSPGSAPPPARLLDSLWLRVGLVGDGDHLVAAAGTCGSEDLF